MPTLEQYIARADEIAQEVVNAWGLNVQAGNADLLSPEFKALVDKACQYRTLRQVADNRREFGIFTEKDAGEESAARRALAEAYKTLRDGHDPIEGALHLVRLNASLSEPKYGIGFASYQLAASGNMKMREVVGAPALRDYLTKRIRIQPEIADMAARELLEKGNAGIERVQLSVKELVDLGLK